MPLQNRVTPFGEITAVSARGMFIGNRGVLHDEQKLLGRRRWVLKAWLICQLEFKGRHRTVMTPRRWTELFFFDEAVAIAAGHRPCYQCRYADFRRWQAAWGEAHGLTVLPRAPEMDVCMHQERIESGTRQKRPWAAPVQDLPDGTFVTLDGTACLVQGDALRPWSWEGYGAPIARPTGVVSVLTPPPSVGVLRAGYIPKLHPSAAD